MTKTVFPLYHNLNLMLFLLFLFRCYIRNPGDISWLIYLTLFVTYSARCDSFDSHQNSFLRLCSCDCASHAVVLYTLLRQINSDLI